MRRYAQTVLLLLLGGLALRLAFSGDYSRYVMGAYLPLLVLAGLGLVAIAGVTLWRDIRTLGAPGDDDATAPMTLGGLFGTVTLSAPDRTGSQPVADRTESQPVVDGPAPDRGSDTATDLSTVDSRERAIAAGLAAAAHEGLDATQELTPAAANEPTAVYGTVPVPAPAPRQPPRADVPPVDPFGTEPVPSTNASPIVAGTRGGWALLLAALAILVLAPQTLGLDAASRLGTAAAATGSPPAVPAEDPAPLSLVDYVQHAVAGGEALGDRRVRLVGFVVAGPRGEPYLARLAIGCCAAGARPVKVGLTGDLPGVLMPGTWVAVIGTFEERFDRDPVNGEPIPYISVVEVSPLEPPTDPYER